MVHAPTVVPLVLGAVNALDGGASALSDAASMLMIAMVTEALAVAGLQEVACIVIAPMLFWLVVGVALSQGDTVDAVARLARGVRAGWEKRVGTKMPAP